MNFIHSCSLNMMNLGKYLKLCGKPKDIEDRFLIKMHKETCAIFGRLLDGTKPPNPVQLELKF